MAEELVHLYVELCSDGTLLAYNPDKSLNRTFTDLLSWNKLKQIYALTTLSSQQRKGIDRELNIKYVKYSFKNTQTNESIEIPSTHIKSIVTNIKGSDS